MKRIHASKAGPAGLGLLAALCAPVATQAADYGFSIGVGGEYATGKYGGDTSIDEVYVPINLAYVAERVAVRLTLPYLSVKAPEGTIVEGPDGEQIIGEGPVTTNDGIGDVVASLTVFDVLSPGGGDFALDLTGEVKFATADETRGLGTGRNDYSIEADGFRFFDRFTVFGRAGYLLRGDPANVDLENAFFATAGGSCCVSSRARLGIFYDYQEASVPGSDAMQELSASFSFHAGASWRTSGYVSTGFSDSSPDWGAGVSFTAGF